MTTAEEAFTFYHEHDGSLSLSSAVHQAIGAASVCWENMEGTGIFQEARAREIADALLRYIADPDAA